LAAEEREGVRSDVPPTASDPVGTDDDGRHRRRSKKSLKRSLVDRSRSPAQPGPTAGTAEQDPADNLKQSARSRRPYRPGPVTTLQPPRMPPTRTATWFAPPVVADSSLLLWPERCKDRVEQCGKRRQAAQPNNQQHDETESREPK